MRRPGMLGVTDGTVIGAVYLFMLDAPAALKTVASGQAWRSPIPPRSTWTARTC